MNHTGQAILRDWGRMNPKLATELASCLLDSASLPGMPDFDEDSNDSFNDQPDIHSGIDLHLECEDDKSYKIPHSEGGLRLQSSNVCMRISFTGTIETESYTCQYCKVNFLSEAHLVHHMFSSHYTKRNPLSKDQDMESDDEEEEDNEEEEEEEAEAIEAKHSKVYSNGHSNGHSHDDSNVNNAVHTSPAQELTPPLTPTLLSQKAKAMKMKRKKAKAERKVVNSRPPILLTIKKSRSDPGIQQTKQSVRNELRERLHSTGPTSPTGIVYGKNEASNDSTSETVDVEASSSSSSPASIKSHASTPTHVGTKKRGSGNIFPCHICGKTYVSKYALKRHIATHSDARPFICSFPDCKGAFKLKSRLTDHIRYVHKQRTQRTAGRSRSLPVTSTPTLAQALLSPSSLGSSAGAAASDSSSVAVANGKVSGSKPFKCSWQNCSREFRDCHNLRMHMCLHTGEMPLRCSLCKYQCIQKVALDIHMKTKHPDAL